MVDPFAGWGLRPVTLADRGTFDSYFGTLVEPLSDYTFSQFYTWRNSLRILWKEIEGNLCVFANGSGDLTLLAPPIGDDSRTSRALAESYDMMDQYNVAKGVPERSRVEYVSEEVMRRIVRAGTDVRPLGMDYVYDVRRMIDLAGGDLASKRQAKNRFMRNHKFRVEPFERGRHLGQCLHLLTQWKQYQDAAAADRATSEPPAAGVPSDPDQVRATAMKREKETLAAELTLDAAEQLGMRGMVVYVEDPDGLERVRGFTFGEELGPDQSSITIEKTDLSAKGLAQFIFSEFCTREWSHRPFVNVGDDWGLDTLAWTKMSYRPVRLLQKYVLRRERKQAVLIETKPQGISLRPAAETDLDAAESLEQTCFTAHSLSRKRLQYFLSRRSAVFLVAEQDGKVIGDGIALVRRHKSGALSGRIYSLAVDADHRGKGVGAKLLDAMVSALAERGVRRVYLEVEEANAAAVRLYERTGFRRAGVLENYYGDGKTGIHMMREIAREVPAGV